MYYMECMTLANMAIWGNILKQTKNILNMSFSKSSQDHPCILNKKYGLMRIDEKMNN